MTAPSVAVVLVTYYGAAHLPVLWASLVALEYPRDRWRLIVIENDPARGAADWFGRRTDDAPGLEVRVIVPGHNTGYAGGNAIGMGEALAAGVDYVAVVTQDTSVEPGWLAALVDVAERHPRAGAVQPKLLRHATDGRAVLHSRGNAFHYAGVGYVTGDGEDDRALDVRAIGYASGAGVLYRARALAAVGGFDPALFMYHEDTDLSWRMRLGGWDVLLAPAAVMWHAYRFDPGPHKLAYIERNRLVNLLTHYRLRTLALLAPALLLFEAMTFAYAVAGGWWPRRTGVWLWFLRPPTWAYLRTKRRQVQSLRRVRDADVVAYFTGRIESPHLPARALRWIVNPLFAGYWGVMSRLLHW